MARTHAPITIEFDSLRFGTAGKDILQGVTGRAEPGQVVAIMGPSGAGKTTLLDMLAGRLNAHKSNTVSGSLLINGKPRDHRTFRQAAAYVLQADYFLPELTVKETITLSATLRLPSTMPLADKHRRALEIIKELGLTKCQDTYVGNEIIRGVSGGERKRVNIGCELVTDPSLVFLDEPTSGLDAASAESVMKTLLVLAKNSRTIITTIHQPRSSIFALFDSLLLLADGRCVYFGNAHSSVKYFADLGYLCPPEYNPTDFFLDTLSYGHGDHEVVRARINTFASAYDAVAKRKQPLAIAASTDSLDKHEVPKYATSWALQFRELTRRSFKYFMRQTATIKAILAQNIVFSILLGLIWLKEGGDESGSSVQSIMGLLSFTVVNISFSAAFGVLFTFPAERAVVLKERASRTYHLGAYFWAKSMTDVPRILVTAMIYTIVVWNLVGLRSGGDHFFSYFILFVLTQIAAEGMAYSVSAAARDAQMAGAIMPVFMVASLLFCGFFINTSAIPVWLRWLRYLSFIRYSFSVAAQIEYKDRTLDLSGCSSAFCPASGNDALDFYGMDELSFATNFGLLLLLGFAFRFLAYFILLRRGPKFEQRL